MSKFKIIECPRDAMQSIKMFIPTEKKIKYIQSLIGVEFDTLDMGSFVSQKAIPQLRDTADVLNSLDLSTSKTKLLVIVANIRGAESAAKFNNISYVGYPFSISENFQMRNTNKTIVESFHTLMNINEITKSVDKELVVYLSMCFGNPYGEVWNLNLIDKWVSKLVYAGIKIISLSDTIGSATPELINKVYAFMSLKYPEIEFGLHLHTTPSLWRDKVEASVKSGCKRLDGAIQGFGGCPMASDDLVGNMPTEKIISFCNENKINSFINPFNFEVSYNYAKDIFKNYR